MRTKLIALAVAVGLSGCYTEFATTGDNYGNYGSPGTNSPGYYDSTYSGYSYDTTGATIINNYYGYPSTYYGWYDNWYTPSPWWWQSNLWFGFGWNPWYSYPYSFYAGYGWGSSYYGYNSPYYYNPFYPYGSAYAYQQGYLSPTGRVRNVGDTRYGRDGYGGGTSAAPNAQPGAGTSVGGANANSSGASANTQSAPAARTRTTNAPPSNGTVDKPQSAPAQPRGRDNGTTTQGRSRGGTSSNYRSGSSHVRHYLHPMTGQSARSMRVRREQQSLRPMQDFRGFASPRSASAPGYSPSVRESAPSAPARAEGSHGGGGGRGRR